MRLRALAGEYRRYPDVFWRHAIVARLLRGADPVVDVGGMPELLAPHLPGASVTVANVTPPADVVFDGDTLPVRDRAFAAAVSLDVLEHVPREKRASHLAELCRVADERVVLCCPLGTTEHVALERELDEWRRAVTGEPDGFLAEHLALGLPSESELRALGRSTEPAWRFALRFHGDIRRAAALFRAATLAGHLTRPRDRMAFALQRVAAAAPGRLSHEPGRVANEAYLVGVRAGGRRATTPSEVEPMVSTHRVGPSPRRSRGRPGGRMTEIEDRLDELKGLGLYRRLRMISGPQGPRVVLDGKPVLLLCSNNYLGLADHPRVRQAAADAAMRWGVGAGASRLVCGNMTIHRRLEERLAAFKGTAACVLFGSGYLANSGIVAALAREGDVVFSDELNHASIIDGCRLARAETFVYRHADTEHLAWGLRQAGPRAALIATDGVFSMDGDVAPLGEIVELAHRHDARVMVDDAHGTGAIGPGGRGTVAAAGLEGEVDVVVGTLSKALGSYGGYACCDTTMAKFLVNSARSLIFSTALPPPAVAGALAALELLAQEPRRVEKLADNADTLRAELAREGFDVTGSETQIVPLVVGDAELAMRVSETAIGMGVFAQAIRPPTVPEGTSRLRLAVMASHSRAELRDAAQSLGRAAFRAGFRPGAAAPMLAVQDGSAAPEHAGGPFDHEQVPRAA